jgi:hypothetical protein
MLLFFQFDLPDQAQMPFETGSHLCVFMCPQHNEIPCFEQYSQLPPEYWNKTEGNAYAILSKPTAESTLVSPGLLEQQSLAISGAPSDRNGVIAIGGEPQWAQDPEHFVCSCGADMRFVCQISENYKFQQRPGAPEQPDTCYDDGYLLFLGNEIYVFACPRQCDPNAVWITVQN